MRMYVCMCVCTVQLFNTVCLSLKKNNIPVRKILIFVF
jgi:hypothetical protein